MEPGGDRMERLPPLAVDLDGTLVLSDTLHESMLALIRRNPFYLFALPVWLLRGKARFKREIARRVLPNIDTLPYNAPLLGWLHEQRGRREIVLCTAGDAALARAVADRVAVFDDTLASDGAINLSGERKAAALAARYGERGFDYAGNARRDLAVWRRARAAVVVNARPSVARAAARIAEIDRRFEPAPAGIGVWLRALRVHQWAKNLLVFLPLLTAHRAFDAGAAGHALLAFVAFCLCASSVYLLNDLLDLDADRQHPRKRQRPFAAGELPLLAGFALAPALLFGAFALALLLPERFLLVLAGYYVLTMAYSLRLKRVEMLDVVVLAALYTARLIAGAAAIPVPASFWLLAFAMFLFLSLALIKRHTELGTLRDLGRSTAAGRGYRTDDLPMLAVLGGASGYLAVLVLALYINSRESERLYRQPELLWLLCPLLLYWINRAWLLTHRGRMPDDPVVFAVRDPVSLGVLLLAVAIILGAV